MSLTVNKSSSSPVSEQKTANKAIRGDQPSTLIEKLARILVVILFVLVFIPDVNPARIFTGVEKYSNEKKAYISEVGKMNINLALFTSATNYETTVSLFNDELTKSRIKVVDEEGKAVKDENGKAIKTTMLEEAPFRTLNMGALLAMVGILLAGLAECASLGNRKMRTPAYAGAFAGSAMTCGGLMLIYSAYKAIESRLNYIAGMGYTDEVAEFNQHLPIGIWVFGILAGLLLLISLVNLVMNITAAKKNQIQNLKFEMPEKYRLFLMMLPVILLAFLFCYLPIYGWRYAFFELVPGDYTLTANKFVGFEQFKYLFQNGSDTLRVLRNTLVMSGLGIATSWLPIAFAVMLAEIPSSKFQRFVQTFTTIPNFISWVLVYAVALAIFSKDGFLNQMIGLLTGNRPDTIYLQDGSMTWLKMLLWGTWKGLGWSAIIYIAGIAGIDQQLYEAARVDGANRWQCIRHVTIPGLLPTYMVMLLMSIAGILSNGMEQYLVFSNAWNTETIEVLDLYVYNIGMGSSANLPLATVVGVTKSLVGVTLLLIANRVSKSIRGESIV